MLRALTFLGIALLIFLPFNWITVRQLVRIHPRGKRWTIGAAVIGNLMWPFLLFLRDSTPLTRFARAVLGPPWFAWLCFALLYSAVIILVLIPWIPFAQKTKFEDFARWPSRVFLTIVFVGSVIGFWQAI